jgi:peptidoglycan/xylan/chitin deacetylase (PgdA/CDA1 family)
MADRLIRLAISLVVGAGDAVMRFFFGSRLPGTCVVINYHAVPDESRKCFAEQLDLVQRLTQPIPAARESTLARGSRYLAITADDLFVSFVRNGLPELNRRKIPVTLFVPTGFLGRNSSWNDYGSENLVGEQVASAEELKQIAQTDTVDFGSHSVMHSDLALLPEAGTRQEMRDSKAALEAIVGREVRGLSFPYGSYTLRELRLATETGYQFCFDSTPQSVVSGMRGGIIGRVSVQPTDWKIEFRLKILGAYRWVRWASSGKKWLRSRLRGS